MGLAIDLPEAQPFEQAALDLEGSSRVVAAATPELGAQLFRGARLSALRASVIRLLGVSSVEELPIGDLEVERLDPFVEPELCVARSGARGPEKHAER